MIHNIAHRGASAEMPTVTVGPLLVHHAANRGYDYPPNSLAGLRRCLEAGARVVEVDIFGDMLRVLNS